jgi:pimeloyl-ACP methyl ester carboxylesterase
MIETKIVAVGNLSFTVDSSGPAAGAPVLLLHGFPQTRRMWRYQLEALARAGYRAMAPDQRGYSAGARPEGVEHYATDLLVGDALSLMDALGAARFHLVGHDWGGQLAWLIAAGHAERVLSLSVLSRPHPAAFVKAMQEDTSQAERSRHHRAFREDDAITRMRAANLKPLRDALERQGVRGTDADEYVRALLEPGAIEGAMNWYGAGNIAVASVLPVHVPTLYVWGDQDATVGRMAAELTAKYVTGLYRFVVIEGAGHFVVDQFPERVSSLLLEHIASATKRLGI